MSPRFLSSLIFLYLNHFFFQAKNGLCEVNKNRFGFIISEVIELFDASFSWKDMEHESPTVAVPWPMVRNDVVLLLAKWLAEAR